MTATRSGKKKRSGKKGIDIHLNVQERSYLIPMLEARRNTLLRLVSSEIKARIELQYVKKILLKIDRRCVCCGQILPKKGV